MDLDVLHKDVQRIKASLGISPNAPVDVAQIAAGQDVIARLTAILPTLEDMAKSYRDHFAEEIEQQSQQTQAQSEGGDPAEPKRD